MEEIVGARIQDVVRDKLFGLERLLKECEPEMSLQGALAFLDATKMILKVTEVYYEERVKKASIYPSFRFRLNCERFRGRIIP